MPPKRLGKHAPPPPDDRRCRRSDGKQWRCPEPALRGFALCVYHHRRSYQIPNEGETSPTQANLEEEEEKDKPKEEEQKPWKLRIKKPNQTNSPNPNPPNPNPPPSPSLSEATENENPNPNPNILPTVLALEHSKSEGRRRRGRKPKNNNNNTPRKEESPLALPKDLTSNNNETNNSNNNNKISGGQRCKRSDGRGWQCKAKSLLGEHYCEHHYHKIKNQQVKKQSHSKSGSKKRRRVSDASLILTKRRREPLTSPPLTSATMSATRELPKGIMTISPSAGVEELGFGGGVRRKLGLGFEAVPISVRPLRSKNPQPVPVGPVKRLALGGGKGVVRRREKEREKDKACHRCGEAEAGPVVRCKHCLKRYFCSKCIQLWYHGMSKLEINSMCPVCRNCCNCDICTRLNNINNNISINKNNNIINTNNFVDVPVEEVANGESKIINIKYASYPFSQLLPIIKKLSIEQLDELEIEAKKQGKRLSGTLVQVLEKGHDEKCNNCKGQIVDFSMNCSDCNYKLCLICSHKIRKEENLETSNFIINCRNKNSCKSNKSSIFHTCDVRCPLVCEGNLGLVYSFAVGWSETLIIGQENNKNAETLIACKSNGHLNDEGFL